MAGKRLVCILLAEILSALKFGRNVSAKSKIRMAQAGRLFFI
jgi:hypothetical protein